MDRCVAFSDRGRRFIIVCIYLHCCPIRIQCETDIVIYEPFLILWMYSGAGKTTLLNALGGTTPRSSGVVLTGSVWYENLLFDANTTTSSHVRYHLSQKEGDIAMLSQHDDFFGMLTPRESLEFAAYLESQKQSTRKDGSKQLNGPKAIAERLLTSLGLLGVADRRIGDRTKWDGGGRGTSRPWMRKLLKIRGGGGGLSGGERRRLSLAPELVTEPILFLADEP